MASVTILSDNGATSGSAGLKTSGGNDGVLILQTTTSGGTATNAIYVDTTQKVGIGTSSPTGTLHVANTSASVGQLRLQYTGYNFFEFQAYSDNKLYISNSSGVAQMVFDGSGNVGVGTSSPADPIEINKSQNSTTTMRVSNTNAGSSAQTRLLLISDGGNIQVKATSTTNTTYGVGDVGVINCDNMSGGLRFSHNDSVGMVYDFNANLLMGATTLASGLGADRAFQLTANSYIFGNSQSNGIVTFTKSIPDNTATTFLTVANIDNWAGTILISYVRNADQNRSGMKMVRYAYNRTFTSLLDSSQNSGATFSVSGNNLQVTIGGAGTYLCQFTIWGGSV